MGKEGNTYPPLAVGVADPPPGLAVLPAVVRARLATVLPLGLGGGGGGGDGGDSREDESLDLHVDLLVSPGERGY